MEDTHLLNNNDYKNIPLEDGVCKKKPKLSWKLLLSYGMGHVFNDVCSSMWFSYLLLFMQYVMQFSSTEAGTLVLIGQLADAFANPIVGYLSDKDCWKSKYGKRKIWHSIGSGATIVSFPLVFIRINVTFAFYIYCVLTIIFQFAWAAVQISHLALIPELTADEQLRTRLGAVRYSFTVMANIFVYVVAWAVIGVTEEVGINNYLGPDDEYKFTIIAVAGVAVGVLSTFIFHYFVKEAPDEQDEKKKSENSITIAEIFTTFEFYKVAMVYMCTMLHVNLTQVIIPLYLHETLEMNQQNLALIPLVLYTGSWIMSNCVGRLNDCIGRKGAYVTGAVMGLIAAAWIKVRSGHAGFNTYDIFVIAVLVGITNAIILVTNLAATADQIGSKTGSGAFIYSIMTVCDKLANGFAVFAIQYLHSTYAAKTYYRDVVAFVCGGAVILGACAVMSLKRHKKIDKEYEALP